jgi:class 3 adenylate cyclase/tetratricopeptide (TPR) repeat protein
MGLFQQIEKAREFLERHGRVSLRALMREFDLDEALLEDLVDELVNVQRVATRDGPLLVRVDTAAAGGTAAAVAPPPAPPSSATHGPPEAPSAAGERRQLTVLFSDLVDSTRAAAALDAEDWRDLVREYQQLCTAVIERHDGHVAQYLGDGVLVYFGYPIASEDDAERAVRAGLGIVGALDARNKTLESKHGQTLAVRVGIHTGPVVVGAAGSDAGSDALAMGDTTHVAARAQSEAAPGTVVVSGSTARLVTGIFVTEDLGARSLKGLPAPVDLYRVVRPSGVRSRLDVSMGRLTPFVGRQTELGVLADAWEHVVEGSGRAVLVRGEAGLGKSRLCHELRQRLASQAHTWLECRCSRYTAGTAFRPVIELVEQALNFQPTDTPPAKLSKLGAGLERAGLTAGESVPLLAEWLRLPITGAGSPVPEMSADAKRSRTLDLLVTWSLTLAELQPMVLLVEDLQWCDPSSLELFGRVIAQSATTRLFFVGTARPDFEQPWPARSGFQTLNLERLTRRQAREMIEAVENARSLPAEVVEQLVARADGVPLYAEELTRAVTELGANTSAAAIPVTLQDSLLARLDRLSSAKEVAQWGAVIGREFPYPLVAAIADCDEAALQQGLVRLVDAELVYVRGEPPEATYTFKHALVQEAAYESLLRRTRQQLHGRIADVLVARFPERANAEPELVARHAEAAGRIDDAIAEYRRAAEQARARSAYQEAMAHLRSAIALLSTLPEGRERDGREIMLQFRLAESIASGRGVAWPEVAQTLERARTLCEAMEDARGTGWAISGLASFSYNAGAVSRASALGRQLLDIAKQANDPDLALRGHTALGAAEFYQGKFASSLAHCQAALELYEPGRRYAVDSVFTINDYGVSARSFAAWGHWALGWPERALDSGREAVALARRIGHPYSLAYALLFKTVLHWIRRDLDSQLEHASEVIALSKAQGFPFWLGLGQIWHASARAVGGDPSAAAELMPSITRVGGTGSLGGASGMFAAVADGFIAAGLFAEARGVVERGLAVADQTGQPMWDAYLHRLLGEIELGANGDADAAQTSFERALGIARAQDARSLELRTAVALARLWSDRGRKSDARALLAPLYGWFSEGLDAPDLRDARALLETHC